MERRAIHEDPDGYYFRSPTGKLYGPLSRFQFEAWSMRGAVGPGSKVWRQQGAHHYRVEISRRLRWRKLLSVRSCGAMSCAQINQCVGRTRQFFTKSFLADDAAALPPSSGEAPVPPRYPAGVASMAWRTTRRFSTNAP